VNEIAALFRQLTAGVYVVGAAHNERRDAFTAAGVMQVSYSPLLLAVSINPEHATYPLVKDSRAFTVNVLKQGQLETARWFGSRSGREHDKLAGVSWYPGRGGAPVLDDALAYFDCELAAWHPAGDHDLILGRVVAGRLIDPGGVPMTYRDTANMDGSQSLYPSSF
jgi:flavin reductase (DIM6/NTAB) family NADH-FMN oxidoreductase RutF